MRLRNVKGSREMIESSPYVIQHPEEYRGKWDTAFPSAQPLHVEIGMGKGQFLLTLAEQNPDINYLGIEMYSSVLCRALERQAEAELGNLFLLRFDARCLLDIFAQNEVEKIYLNFSDPWPKDRHAKRRLTSPRFLAMYDEILAENGSIQFKTDNRALFDFSVDSVRDSGLWHIDELTYDLHNSEFLEGNILTEYECRFLEEGKPICRFVISR